MAHTRGLKGGKHTGKIPARQTHWPLHDGSGRCVFFLLLQAIDKFHGPDAVFHAADPSFIIPPPSAS